MLTKRATTHATLGETTIEEMRILLISEVRRKGTGQGLENATLQDNTKAVGSRTIVTVDTTRDAMRIKNTGIDLVTLIVERTIIEVMTEMAVFRVTRVTDHRAR